MSAVIEIVGDEVLVRHGFHIREPLKMAGCRFRKSSKAWVAPIDQLGVIENIVAAEPPAPDPSEKIAVIGKARYRDRPYYIREEYTTEHGVKVFELVSFSGRESFICRREEVTVVKRYVDKRGEVRRVDLAWLRERYRLLTTPIGKEGV